MFPVFGMMGDPITGTLVQVEKINVSGIVEQPGIDLFHEYPEVVSNQAIMINKCQVTIMTVKLSHINLEDPMLDYTSWRCEEVVIEKNLYCDAGGENYRFYVNR